jgi:endonuclease/exonuclease/phosphatase family metal-dependent hydrolase
MQEVTEWHAGIIADIVYPRKGDFRITGRSAIMTRGQVGEIILNPMKHSQHATIKLDGQAIDCVNFQLKSAITDMRMWQPSCWKKHAANRKTQRKQVNLSLTILKDGYSVPRRPVVAAGDFNAPASDPLHDLLRRNFIDSFSEVGSGWANTWHRRIPFQRIDYIYTSPELKPVRSCNVVIPASDHLMVVSDFILLR